MTAGSQKSTMPKNPNAAVTNKFNASSIQTRLHHMRSWMGQNTCDPDDGLLSDFNELRIHLMHNKLTSDQDAKLTRNTPITGLRIVLLF